MKSTFAILLVVAAVALGACRREEAVPAPGPLKLGGPAVTDTAR